MAFRSRERPSPREGLGVPDPYPQERRSCPQGSVPWPSQAAAEACVIRGRASSPGEHRRPSAMARGAYASPPVHTDTCLGDGASSSGPRMHHAPFASCGVLRVSGDGPPVKSRIDGCGIDRASRPRPSSPRVVRPRRKDILAWVLVHAGCGWASRECPAILVAFGWRALCSVRRMDCRPGCRRAAPVASIGMWMPLRRERGRAPRLGPSKSHPRV